MALPRRVLVMMLVMVALTTAPYVVALAAAPKGTTFRGTILDIVDYNSHLAKMQQGLRGEWLYQVLFTTEPHEAALLQTFYVALGHVARWTGLSPDVTYHLARIIFTALMVWALWAFLRHYLDENAAWWALLLCLFAGGVGYLIYVLNPAQAAQISPIEFWLLDGYTFLASFTFPHFAAGIALLCLAFLMLDRWTALGTPGSFAVFFLAALALGLVQPFDLPLIDIVALLVVGWRAVGRRIPAIRALIGLALVGIAHGALLGYDYLVLYALPVWRDFTAQNVTLSPPPVYYLLGYAPLLIPALGGIILALRRREERWLVPILWVGTVACLLYAPLATQRRFLLGIPAPLAALAVSWLATDAVPRLARWNRRRARSVLAAYGALATHTTLALLVWLVLAAGSPANADLFTPDSDAAAWAWIAQQTPTESVVLAGFKDGGAITGRTGRRSVLGHWFETIDYLKKREAVSRFFSVETTDDWRREFLSAQRASYIWYSAEERALGGWSPAGASFLRPVFESAGVTLYQVVLPGGGAP